MCPLAVGEVWELCSRMSASEVGWGKTKRDVECSKASDPGQIRKGLSRTLTGFTNWAESPFMELL